MKYLFVCTLNRRNIAQSGLGAVGMTPLRVPMLEIFNTLRYSFLTIIEANRRIYCHCAQQLASKPSRLLCLLSAHSDAFHCFC